MYLTQGDGAWGGDEVPPKCPHVLSLQQEDLLVGD